MMLNTCDLGGSCSCNSRLVVAKAGLLPHFNQAMISISSHRKSISKQVLFQTIIPSFTISNGLNTP